jgi:hypothetical protein
MSAFERRRLYDSKVRGLVSNQSLASSTSSLSAPQSRHSTPDREVVSLQDFKPITPLAKLKKNEAERVLPKPPTHHSTVFNMQDSPNESDFSFFEPE